jgi:hypothetical protein
MYMGAHVLVCFVDVHARDQARMCVCMRMHLCISMHMSVSGQTYDGKMQVQMGIKY